jgi:hypothetical protein
LAGAPPDPPEPVLLLELVLEPVVAALLEVEPAPPAPEVVVLVVLPELELPEPVVVVWFWQEG